MNSTYFGLLAEFEAAEIPLEDCCLKYFSLDAPLAKRRAAAYALPVPAYRATAGQKGRWMVSAHDLAAHIDAQKAEASKLHKSINGSSHLRDAG